MSMSRTEARGNARPREMAVNYRIRLIGVLRDSATKRGRQAF